MIGFGSFPRHALHVPYSKAPVAVTDDRKSDSVHWSIRYSGYCSNSVSGSWPIAAYHCDGTGMELVKQCPADLLLEIPNGVAVISASASRSYCNLLHWLGVNAVVGGWLGAYPLRQGRARWRLPVAGPDSSDPNPG